MQAASRKGCARVYLGLSLSSRVAGARGRGVARGEREARAWSGWLSCRGRAVAWHVMSAKCCQPCQPCAISHVLSALSARCCQPSQPFQSCAVRQGPPSPNVSCSQVLSARWCQPDFGRTKSVLGEARLLDRRRVLTTLRQVRVRRNVRGEGAHSMDDRDRLTRIASAIALGPSGVEIHSLPL